MEGSGVPSLTFTLTLVAELLFTQRAPPCAATSKNKLGCFSRHLQEGPEDGADAAGVGGGGHRGAGHPARPPAGPQPAPQSFLLQVHHLTSHLQQGRRRRSSRLRLSLPVPSPDRRPTPLTPPTPRPSPANHQVCPAHHILVLVHPAAPWFPKSGQADSPQGCGSSDRSVGGRGEGGASGRYQASSPCLQTPTNTPT